MTAGRQRSAAILLLVLLLAMSATPFAAGGQTYGDVTVMDAALRDALAEGEADGVHRVIVQFSSPLGEAVDKVLADHDATVLGTAALVDGHLVEANT